MATSAGAVYVDVKANTKPFEGSMGGLGSLAKGIMGKLMAGVSVAALTAFAKSCTDVASDLIEVQNVVDVTFKSMSASMDEWAKGAIDTFGLSETMAKRYAGTYGSMAEAFGFTEAEAYKMSTTLAGLAGDVASFYNMSQDEAYTKLKSVFSGETESLKELGVVMTQAALDQYALANGYGKTVQQMTEAEKVSLRFAFVQSQLANATGDFARTSGSWANQTRLLKLRFDQLRATLGQAFIAALLPVVRGLNAVVQAATNAANAFLRIIEAITGRSMAELTGQAEQVSVDLSDVGTGAQDAADALGGLSDAQGAAADAADSQNAAQKALNKTLAGFDRINRLTSSSAASASGGSGGGGGSTSGGSTSGGSYAAGGGIAAAAEAEAERASSALSKIAIPEPLIAAITRLKTAFGELGDTIGGGLKWGYDNVLVPLRDFTINTVLPDCLNLLADAVGHLNEFLQKISDPLSRFLTLVKEGLMWAWEEVLEPLGNWTINEALPRVLEGLGTAFNIIVTCLEKLKPVAQFIWDEFVKPLAEKVGEALIWALDKINEGLQWVLDEVSKADFTEFLDNLKAVKEWLGDKLSAAAEAAKGALETLGKKWDALKEGTKNLWVEAKEKAKGALETLGKNWDALKEGTKNLLVDAKEKAEGAIEALCGKWDALEEGTKELLADAREATEGAIEALCGKWDALKAGTKELWVDAREKAKDSLVGIKRRWDAIKSSTKKLVANVRTTLPRNWEKVKQAFKYAREKMRGATRNVTATVKGHMSRNWASVREAVTWANRSLRTKTATITGTVRGYIVDAWKYIRRAFEWVKDGGFNVGKRSAQIYGAVKGYLHGSWDRIRAAFDWARYNMFNRNGAIYGSVSGFIDSAWQRIKDAFNWASYHMHNISATISLRLEGALMDARGAVNNVIGWINNKLNGLQWPRLQVGNQVVGGGNIFPWNPIPYLAQGGWVAAHTPRLAVIGDNPTEGEIVSPESKLRAMAEEAARGGGSDLLPVLNAILSELRGMDTATYLDGRAIARSVVSHVNAQTRATGRSPILV